MRTAGTSKRWTTGSIDPVLSGPYDLVYDSGCLHHLPPHRRIRYLALLERVLTPGGHLALACFAAGKEGAEAPDSEFYRGGGLEGGLAFGPGDLRWLFADYTEIEIRPMRAQPATSSLFGLDFLLTGLFRRRSRSSGRTVDRAAPTVG